MIFRRGKKTVKRSMTTVDKLVTGVIVTGAAASIFWLSRTKKGRSITQKILSGGKNVGQKGVELFWKATIGIIDLIKNKKR